MSTDDNAGGGVFTTKDMLVRMDGKLDVVLAHQATIDTRLALVEQKASDLAGALKDHEALPGHSGVLTQLNDITRRLAYASGATAVLVGVVEIAAHLLPF